MVYFTFLFRDLCLNKRLKTGDLHSVSSFKSLVSFVITGSSYQPLSSYFFSRCWELLIILVFHVLEIAKSHHKILKTENQNLYSDTYYFVFSWNKSDILFCLGAHMSFERLIRSKRNIIFISPKFAAGWTWS